MAFQSSYSCQFIAAALLICVSFAIDDSESPETQVSFIQQTDEKALYLETFASDPFKEGRWAKSTDKKYANQKYEIAKGPGKFAADQVLHLTQKAAHYGLASMFKESIEVQGNDLVIQYELQLKNGLECGGAYIKVLKDEEGLSAEKLKDDTPYAIMFGPDKCGATNKVHFIFQHQNPVSNEWSEHHLKTPPSIKTDEKPHLYTLVIRKDNSFSIYIDQHLEKSGSLLKDFEPPVNPPKMIPDPEDKKPADWVDEKKIDDPSASKPEDWDEDAPMEIPDEEAVRPAGWQDDAPEEIPDPDAKKPDDWDDEEDGDWEAPLIPNPVCSNPGCGEWKRPLIKNPAYKGKWHAPQIDNPAYKGEWKQKEIENKNWFEDNEPANLTPIAGIALEIWTMSSGLHFDNFYVGQDEAAAKAFGKRTWADRKVSLQAAEDAERANKAREAREAKRKAGGFSNLLEVYFMDAMDVLNENLIIAVVSLVAAFAGLLYYCCKDDDSIEDVEYEREQAETGDDTDDSKAEGKDGEDAAEEDAAEEDAAEEDAKGEADDAEDTADQKAGADADDEASSGLKRRKGRSRKAD